MDTGENKLNAEMMKKLREEYEKYKVGIKDKYEKIKHILEICGVDKPKLNSKVIKQIMIDEEESQKARFIKHGSYVKNVTIDEFNLDDKYTKSETKIPRETITIDSIPEDVREKAEHDAILYGDSFVSVNRAPRWVERYLETQRWIDGIRDPEIDILTGCTQNFRTQQKLDMMETLYDIFDTEAPDRNGRIWKREVIEDILNNRIYLITPRRRTHKSWLWLKLLELQKSYEVRLQKTLDSPPSTKFDLKSVIYMRWPKPDLSNLKARDFRYGKMWQDQELINYATSDVSHIDTIILDSLATFGPDINSGYGMSTPNLNDIDKKKLERIIKKNRIRRKKK